jgi:hypothetical protein
MSHSALAAFPLTLATAGEGDSMRDGGESTGVVMATVFTNAIASDSCSRAGQVVSSPGCSKPRVEDFLHITSSQIDTYHYEPTNYNWKVLEYL